MLCSCCSLLFVSEILRVCVWQGKQGIAVFAGRIIFPFVVVRLQIVCYSVLCASLPRKSRGPSPLIRHDCRPQSTKRGPQTDRNVEKEGRGTRMMGPIRGADYGGKKRTINILLNTSIDLHTFLQPQQHGGTDERADTAVSAAYRVASSFGNFGDWFGRLVGWLVAIKNAVELFLNSGMEGM